MYPISWNNICKPKERRPEGGTGFSSATAIVVESAKGRVIPSKRNTIWVEWAHSKYIRNKSFYIA